jgi:hypothetical protein
MSGFLSSFSNSRGWGRINNNVFSPFWRSFLSYGQWFAISLFKRKPIESPYHTGNKGWQHIAGFLGALLPLVLAIVPGIPFAIFLHSLGGFLDAVYGVGKKSVHWATGYQSEPGSEPGGAGNLHNEPERNNLQTIFAFPGYVLSAPLLLVILLSLASFKITSPLVRGIWAQVIKPFFQGIFYAFVKSMKAFFGIKKQGESFKNLEFLEGQGNIQKLTFSLGALIGITIAAPFSIPAVIWHSFIGFVEALVWGISKIWEQENGKKNFFDKDVQLLNRYSAQRLLAAPGYALGFIACAPVLVSKIAFEIIKPFFEGTWEAFSQGILALFGPEDAGPALKFTGIQFLQEHNVAQRLLFSVGALIGITIAAPFSIPAVIWHSFIGFFEALVWGMSAGWKLGKPSNFFTRGQHIAIIDNMLAERGNDANDQQNLEELKEALATVLDAPAAPRIRV